MTLKITALILWVITGILVLATPEKVSKFSYTLCWITLLLQLASRLLE